MTIIINSIIQHIRHNYVLPNILEYYVGCVKYFKLSIELLKLNYGFYFKMTVPDSAFTYILLFTFFYVHTCSIPFPSIHLKPFLRHVVI